MAVDPIIAQLLMAGRGGGSPFTDPTMSSGFAPDPGSVPPGGAPPPNLSAGIPQPAQPANPDSDPLLRTRYQPQPGVLPAPSREPGLFKRLLMNFTYNMGQTMEHAVGMPTDQEKQQQAFAQNLATTREQREGQMANAQISNMQQLRAESEQKMRYEQQDRETMRQQQAQAMKDREQDPKNWDTSKRLNFLQTQMPSVLQNPEARDLFLASGTLPKDFGTKPKEDLNVSEIETYIKQFGPTEGLRRYHQAQLQLRMAGRDSSAADARRSDLSYRFHTQQIDKIAAPLDQQAQRMQRLKDSLDANSPQADALVAPELLTAMAGGQGSGLRMNEAEISRIVGGRNAWQDLKSRIERYQLDPSKPFAITTEQRGQIRKLIDAVSGKISRQQDILNNARESMANTDDPNTHKRIYGNVRKQFSDIISGQDQQGGGGAYNPAFVPKSGRKVR